MQLSFMVMNCHVDNVQKRPILAFSLSAVKKEKEP